MNYDWAFLPMESATPLLGDRAALAEQMSRDGYLYFDNALDVDKLTRLRRAMLDALRSVGWIDPESVLMRGRSSIRPVREGSDDFFEGYDAIQRLEPLHELAHDEKLTAIMEDVVGEGAFPHPLKIARLIFPAHFEISTPPHQDYPNNQGTESLTATWIPLGDLPSEMGGLAILRGSHRYGVLPLTAHSGAGNRCAVLPPRLLEECRWVTTDFSMGDVLVFPSHTVHAARHNNSEFWMRLSVDFRFQREGEPLTSGCLEPHFERLSWDEIYDGWSPKAHRYYWRDLDYEVVPFEEFPLERQVDALTEAKEFIAYERRLDNRMGNAGDQKT
jgi:ectoine hydroxylase-related dioxygenase (phytanoyl-CoA dioxygenase family)